MKSYIKIILTLILFIILTVLVTYKETREANLQKQTESQTVEKFEDSTPSSSINTVVQKMEDFNVTDDKNTVYAFFVVNNSLEIYHDKGSVSDIGGKATSLLVGSVNQPDKPDNEYENKVYKFVIPNFNFGDRLLIYYKNSQYSGYIGGHIRWNGRDYPTTDENFSVLSVETSTDKGINNFVQAGRRVGCYRDGPDRRLVNYLGKGFTHEQCRDKAIEMDYPYYGLQYGGECFIDKDLDRATSYGKIDESNCLMKDNSKPFSNQQLGGNWANDLYNTFESPKFRMCSLVNTIKATDSANNLLLGIHKNARILKLEQGANCENSELEWTKDNKKYGFVEVEWKPLDPPEISFCSDPDFTEFYPVGCSDPTSKRNCDSTVNKGFKSDNNLCKNKYNVSYNDYDNPDFYKMVSEAWQIINTDDINKPALINKFSTDLRSSINNTMEACCNILSKQRIKDGDNSFNINTCISETRNQFNSSKYYDMVNETSKLCRSGELKENQHTCNLFTKALSDTFYAARTIISLSMKPTAQFIADLNTNTKTGKKTVRSIPVPKAVPKNTCKIIKIVRVRTSPDGANVINLAEIEVFDDKGNKIPNLTNKNSSTHPAGPDGNLVDGRKNNFAHTLNNQIGDEMTITLPTQTSISRVRITNRQDCCGHRAIGLQVRTFDSTGIQPITTIDINDYSDFYEISYNQDSAPSIKSSPWSCIPGVNTPLRINQNNDVECMAFDRRNCIWQDTPQQCNRVKNAYQFNNRVAPLSCGKGHQSQYGTTGYSDGPGHWCNKGKNALNK